MKKRLFLVALMVAIFACLFTLVVSAENKIIKLDTLPTLEQIHANRDQYVSEFRILLQNIKFSLHCI
jgi:hypothetical protein